MKFSIQKGSQTQRLVKESQRPCSEQFSWQAGGQKQQGELSDSHVRQQKKDKTAQYGQPPWGFLLKSLCCNCKKGKCEHPGLMPKQPSPASWATSHVNTLRKFLPFLQVSKKSAKGISSHHSSSLTYWLCWFPAPGRWGSLTAASAVHFLESRPPPVLWRSDGEADSAQKTPSSCCKSDKMVTSTASPNTTQSFPSVCHYRDSFRIPHLFELQVYLLMQQTPHWDIWSNPIFKAGMVFSLLMASSSQVSNISKHNFACSH